MPYASKGLYLEMEAGYYKLSSEAYGFVARIDGSGSFQILLSDRYFNKTCGLCGDFNIFAEDDFRTQEGKPFWGAISWRYGYASCSQTFTMASLLAHQPLQDLTSMYSTNLISQHSISLLRLLGVPQT